MGRLQDYRKSLKGILRQATLCILVRDGQVLLAMKKKGFGQGRWNGVGGKPNPGESIEKAAIRETKEEIGIAPKSLKRMATLNFYFPDVPLDEDWNQQVCVFVVDQWKGKLTETEEMKPQWFDFSEIPYDSMWPDDTHWLPKVLQGIPVRGNFMFDENQELEEFGIQEGSW